MDVSQLTKTRRSYVLSPRYHFSNLSALYVVTLQQWFLTMGSIESQGFGGLVHPARLCTNTVYSYIHMFEFEEERKAPTMKGSMNSCMELVGFITSEKVKNHCSTVSLD